MRRHASIVALAVLLVVASGACAQGGRSAGQPAQAGPAAKPGAQEAPPALRPNYFAGKTITAIVNFTAGGPTDVFARSVIPYLKRYVPGQPEIVVENKPGGGGVIGINHLYSVSRKDGYTMGFFTSPFGQQIMEAEGVQYDAAALPWLGGVSETSIFYVGASVGAKNGPELARTTAEIIIGGLSPESSKDLTLRTYLNMLGQKYRYVTGYPGTADINLAFRRGEVNYGEEAISFYANNAGQMVKEGAAFAISQRGISRDGQVIRDPRAADIPTHLESVVEVKGEAARSTVEYRAMTMLTNMVAVQRAIVYPPGVSPEIVAAMRQAVAAAFADPEFLAVNERQLGFQLLFHPGEESQEIAELVISQAHNDPEALEYLKRLSREKN